MNQPLYQGLLGTLPGMAGVTTRQISAENPTGAKGGGCQAIPNPDAPDLVHSRAASKLGQGWKVRPFIKVPAGRTVTLADIEGPGRISQLFFTSDHPRLSEMVLRIYWDGESTPSVEVPAGAFFAIGHDLHPHLVSSLPVTVAPYRGCSCYWPMPFARSARVTLTHEGTTDANVVAYRVLYHPGEVAPGTAYFHAHYRRTLTERAHPEHTILDGVRGQGVYVGTYLAWNSLSSGWWGEGEVKFYLDGDTEFPTLADNGTEDYFGGAWNFGGFNPNRPEDTEQAFSAPFVGMPLALTSNPGGPRKFSLYRWHVLDCIGFSSDLKVTVQALGWYPSGTYQPLTDDIASTAYWYQVEPHNPFPTLLGVEQRWDR